MDALKKQVDGTHYKDMGIQPWEIIEKNHLDYFEGAALKYLLRWKQKDGIIDLDKIIHYVERIKELAQKGYYAMADHGDCEEKHCKCINTTIRDLNCIIKPSGSPMTIGNHDDPDRFKWCPYCRGRL